MNRKEEINMSTIGGLTGTTTSSIRGYGGLASGLDRDTLIEGMTYGTTSKITQQQQKKQQIEWKQSAVQSITSMMLSFANKYTSSWSSSTNLFSSVFWGRSNITTTGANSKFVSVSGSAKTADAIKIMGVKQLAQKAKLSSSSKISSGELTTGDIDVTKTQTEEKLLGESLTFKYGDKSYSIFLGAKDGDTELNYDTVEEAVKSINAMLAKEEVGTSSSGGKQTLADIVEVAAGDDGNFVFKNKGAGTNSLYVTGGSALEIMMGDKTPEDGYNLSKTSTNTDPKAVGAANVEITREISFAEKIAGKRLDFTYNGITKSITIPSEEKLNAKDKDGKVDVMANLQSALQTELNKAFGSGRIEVGLKDGTGVDKDGNQLKQLTFKTKNPTTGGDDTSSSLTLTSGNSELLGANGALNVKYGESTNLNLNAKITEAGFKNLTFGADVKDEDVVGTFKINGTDITVKAGDTVKSVMDQIKNKTGVSVDYQAASDKFTFSSNENGASGSIKFEGDADFITGLFGIKSDEIGKEIRGQDAIVSVKYAGSDDEVELYRDSNTFTVDGLTINVKGEFGYKDGTTQAVKDGKPLFDEEGNAVMEQVRDKSSEAVEINATVNADSIVDAVKAMVEEYNAIIEKVNKEVSTKPDRDYAPLTSEQKKELTDDEIELYEEKAKQGLLFGDSDLRGLSSDLRFIIGGGNAYALEKIGITTSSTYSDNGKLTLDESKLRAALQSDPESVEKLFTATETRDESGKITTHNGIATNLKNVMDKYVNTVGSMDTKGILIRKAGTESSPLSMTENYMYKQIAEINKQILKLQTKLQAERDRYVKQFTSLETLISQMNSQSNYLSQIGGAY